MHCHETFLTLVPSGVTSGSETVILETPSMVSLAPVTVRRRRIFWNCTFRPKAWHDWNMNVTERKGKGQAWELQLWNVPPFASRWILLLPYIATEVITIFRILLSRWLLEWRSLPSTKICDAISHHVLNRTFLLDCFVLLGRINIVLSVDNGVRIGAHGIQVDLIYQQNCIPYNRWHRFAFLLGKGDTEDLIKDEGTTQIEEFALTTILWYQNPVGKARISPLYVVPVCNNRHYPQLPAVQDPADAHQQIFESVTPLVNQARRLLSLWRVIPYVIQVSWKYGRLHSQRSLKL